MRRLIIALVCLVVAALLLYRFVPHQGSLVETVALANGPFDLRVRAYSEVGTGYVYSGWEYAVTTDSGKTWSRWDATRDLQGWRCCNYSLIDSVRFEPSGRGTMYLGLKPVHARYLACTRSTSGATGRVSRPVPRIRCARSVTIAEADNASLRPCADDRTAALLLRPLVRGDRATSRPSA